MNKIKSYDKALLNISPRQWPEFLKAHAFLHDGRLNFELAEAFAQIGTLMDFKKYIKMDEESAPPGSREEFLTFCGVLGYGTYLSNYYDAALLLELQEKANDTRKHVRKAVALALKKIGQNNIRRLERIMKKWRGGSSFEMCAVIAALSELSPLKQYEVAEIALELLDWATALIVDEEEFAEGLGELETELSSAWEILTAIRPVQTKPLIERWIKEQNPAVDKIMQRNLLKTSLQDEDPEWVNKWLSVLDERQ